MGVGQNKRILKSEENMFPPTPLDLRPLVLQVWQQPFIFTVFMSPAGCRLVVWYLLMQCGKTLSQVDLAVFLYIISGIFLFQGGIRSSGVHRGQGSHHQNLTQELVIPSYHRTDFLLPHHGFRSSTHISQYSHGTWMF